MSAVEMFDQALNQSELRIFRRLTTPREIQAYLDELLYSADPFYRCPLRVLRERTAHCFDGALFAAAALRRLGHPPLILDIVPNDRDDDHLLALFKRNGHWGAVAKSNFVGLRFREPVYRTLRELVMSYFEQYHNVAGEKTLRGYTAPLNLTAFDKQDWMTRDEPLEGVAQRLDEVRQVKVVTEAMIAELSQVDDRSLKAGLQGLNEAGLFKL
ncbi:MAG: hypothetical protein MUO87_08970 [Thermoplasmata archaeon]|nr:hypothetical protein [Thermoplasmata archaeon]